MTDSTSKKTTLPELQNLSDQIGEFIHYWGFKRIHGRLWTHIFLAERPLDAADLIQQLDISKALVSISLRELLEYDVIQEVGKSARGTLLYRTNPDILSVILSVLRKRERRMLSNLQAAQDGLTRVSQEERAEIGLSGKHLDQLSNLISKASAGLDSIVSLQAVDFGEWREAFLTADLAEEAELRRTSVQARKPAPGQVRQSEPQSEPTHV